MTIIGRASLTVWNPIIETVSDAIGVFSIFSFEFILASLPITTRENKRNKFVILAELGEGLRNMSE